MTLPDVLYVNFFFILNTLTERFKYSRYFYLIRNRSFIGNDTTITLDRTTSIGLKDK